ncbi:MAG: hypothetical protein M3Q79_04125, partial [bacterium]|nr:hypothetical protein [bacterium]
MSSPERAGTSPHETTKPQLQLVGGVESVNIPDVESSSSDSKAKTLRNDGVKATGDYSNLIHAKFDPDFVRESGNSGQFLGGHTYEVGEDGKAKPITRAKYAEKHGLNDIEEDKPT